MKNDERDLLNDMLTKPFGQRYDESTKGEKIAYWISVVIVAAIILYMWVVKLGLFQ